VAKQVPQRPDLEGGEALNERVHGVNVQVVGGLVQQQDVRLGEGQLGKRHA
jgi:hypothetical protein